MLIVKYPSHALATWFITTHIQQTPNTNKSTGLSALPQEKEHLATIVCQAVPYASKSMSMYQF